MKRLSLLACAAVLLACASAAQGQAAPTGFRAEFLRQFDDANSKLVRLAEAMPADKFTWRPMEGVRSVAESYTHLAALNYNIGRLLGTPLPEGIAPSGLNAVTDKPGVVKVLRDSFTHMRAIVEKMSDADMEKAAKLGQRDTVTREVLLVLISGLREHLGQSVAYARFHQVVPPWTAERQTQQQPAKQR